MRFALLDRIVSVEVGSRICATKSLSLSEEYLQDHFPHFPVMPGVLMLEAMYQASAWLLRVTDGFTHSVVVLKEARNVRFSDFVRPGQTLEVQAEIHKRDGNLTTLKTSGKIGDTGAVNARLILERRNLADKDPINATTDQILIEQFKSYWGTISSDLQGITA